MDVLAKLQQTLTERKEALHQALQATWAAEARGECSVDQVATAENQYAYACECLQILNDFRQLCERLGVRLEGSVGGIEQLVLDPSAVGPVLPLRLGRRQP